MADTWVRQSLPPPQRDPVYLVENEEDFVLVTDDGVPLVSDTLPGSTWVNVSVRQAP